VNNDKAKPQKTILSSADDVRMAAGLLALEEVDRLLDRVEGLKLNYAVEKGVNAAFKQAIPTQVKAIDGVILKRLERLDQYTDDPLALKSPRLMADSPHNDNRLICYLIIAVLGVLIGALATYILMR